MAIVRPTGHRRKSQPLSPLTLTAGANPSHELKAPKPLRANEIAGAGAMKPHGGRRFKNQRLPMAKRGNEGRKGGRQDTHPPTSKGARGSKPLLKFAPYFSTNLFPCNPILQNREIGLGNPEGEPKRSQDFLKNGVFWAEWEQVRAQVGRKSGASRRCPK